MGVIRAPVVQFRYVPGLYYFTIGCGPGTTQTIAPAGNGFAYYHPVFLPHPITIATVGAEVTTTGDVGSKVRIGAYFDNGSGLPGKLAFDAGVIAGDSATAQELTINQPLSSGIYHFGLAVQQVTTTRPTIRFYPSLRYDTQGGAGIPTTSSTFGGFFTTGVTTSLPASSGITTSGLSSSQPRIFFKVG